MSSAGREKSTASKKLQLHLLKTKGCATHTPWFRWSPESFTNTEKNLSGLSESLLRGDYCKADRISQKVWQGALVRTVVTGKLTWSRLNEKTGSVWWTHPFTNRHTHLFTCMNARKPNELTPKDREIRLMRDVCCWLFNAVDNLIWRHWTCTSAHNRFPKLMSKSGLGNFVKNTAAGYKYHVFFSVMSAKMP